MKSIKKKIVITGGKGRFAETLKKKNKSLNISYPDKRKLNILSSKSIEKYFKKIRPKYVLHAAALSRPMDIHNKKISKSIDLNIIGTANIVKVCELILEKSLHAIILEYVNGFELQYLIQKFSPFSDTILPLSA